MNGLAPPIAPQSTTEFGSAAGTQKQIAYRAGQTVMAHVTHLASCRA